MEEKSLGDRMKSYEVSTPADSDNYIAVRVDGRSFSKLTESHFQKPADYCFLDIMDEVTRQLLEDTQASYIYTQSDEISFVLPRGAQLFAGRCEKIASTAAGLASAVFSLKFGEPIVFDGRAIVLPTDSEVMNYFYWRAIDGFRNAVSTALYWKLRSEAGASKATATLVNLSTEKRMELLGGPEKYLESVPGDRKQRERFWFGKAFFWTRYEKVGTNPITGETTTVTRRKMDAGSIDVFTSNNPILRSALDTGVFP